MALGRSCARHERRQQRLVGRPAERLGDAGAERQRQHRVDGHVLGAAEDQRGQHEGAGGLDELRADQQPAPIVAIGDDAADQRQQQDRQLADEGVEAEPERRAADRQHQPVLRDLLHPRARRRQHVAAPEQAEVAGGERRGESGEAAARRRGRWFRAGLQGGGIVPRFGPLVSARATAVPPDGWRGRSPEPSSGRLAEASRQTSGRMLGSMAPGPISQFVDRHYRHFNAAAYGRGEGWTRHLDRRRRDARDARRRDEHRRARHLAGRDDPPGQGARDLLHRREPRRGRLQPRRARPLRARAQLPRPDARPTSRRCSSGT